MVQVCLTFFGVVSLVMMHTDSARLRKWSPVIGLTGQPFWLYFALTTSPLAYGVVVTSVLFTGGFIYGIYKQWFKGQRPAPLNG